MPRNVLLTFLSGAIALALAACVTPATEVLVVVGTDVDPAVPFSFTATVARGGDGGHAQLVGPFVRRSPGHGDAGALDAGGLDGGSRDAAATGSDAEHHDGGPRLTDMPASFAVVPGEAGDDGTVSLLLEGDAGGVALRRRASFSFARGQTTVVRIFLSSRCAADATGCRPGVVCTVQQLCEDRGETCGNEGSCVPVQTTPGHDLDGSFGDVSAPLACGMYGQACCAVGTACGGALSCVAGVCRRCTDPGEVCCSGADLRPDGTVCAATTDPCKRAGTCMAGACQAIADAPDGTMCGDAPDNCHAARTCHAGACSADALPDGTACGAAPDNCHAAQSCHAGACSADALPDGTACGTAPNECRTTPTCRGGACGASGNVADGTPCGGAPSACHSQRRCSGGACGGSTTSPDGTDLGGGNYCCGGSSVSRSSPSHCGICGISCPSGTCHNYNGQYFCYCAGSDAQCSPRICRTFSPGNNNCACQSNADCPGAHCVNVSGGPNYCSY